METVYCHHCGKPIDPSAKFCPYCGTEVPTAAPEEDATQKWAPMLETDATQKWAPMPETDAQSPAPEAAAGSDAGALPMGWHRFVVNFSLIAGGILNILSGLLSLTGAEYGENREALYLLLHGLQAVDVLYGIAWIGMGVFMFFVRGWMKKFTAKGPKMLMWVYIGAIVLNLSYAFIAVGILNGANLDGGSVWSSEFFANLIASVVQLFINRSYYKKREALFIN